ncbi:MAG: hypothetical protein AAF249_12580 [Pseudomonadota bacterium]
MKNSFVKFTGLIALLIFAFYPAVVSASYGGAKVNKRRCSSEAAEAIRDMAFMRRIGTLSPYYQEHLSIRVRNDYIPQDIRLRKEPYRNETRAFQTARALEVSRSANRLKINCRKRLVGAKGRAWDRYIGDNFETRPRGRYFRPFIKISDDGLSGQFETSEDMQARYISRMGTIHHEVFHSWSYDHKPHRHRQYNNSMNQLARRALEHVMRNHWLDKTNTPSCFRLRRCRLHGHLLMRDRENNPYLGFDPARTGIGLLGYRYPQSRNLDSRQLSLWDAALYGHSYRTALIDGEPRQTISREWFPKPSDTILAVSQKRVSRIDEANLNEFLVRTDDSFRVIKWGGEYETPDFFVKATIPFDAPVPLLRGDTPTRVTIPADANVLAYDSKGRNHVFVQRSQRELLNVTSETTGFKLNYALAVGTPVPRINGRGTVRLDGRIRFLGQMDVNATNSPPFLIGTETQLVLIQPMQNGNLLALATYRGEAWSGPSRFDEGVADLRPPVFGNFLDGGFDELLLANDSGLSLLTYSAGQFRVAGQMRFQNAFDGYRFNEFFRVRHFGKYAFSNDKDAVIFSQAGFLRVTFFNSSGNPQVFARIGGPTDEDRLIRGQTQHNREPWIYQQQNDQPIMAADMTGNGLSEVVLARKNPANPRQILGLGVAKAVTAQGGNTLDFRDFRYTGCFDREACHEGTFGHWLLRTGDVPLGFLYDNDTGNALMLMQNRRLE